jgi:hypothetical protein
VHSEPLNPNLLFRSLTAVGIKKVRFKEIDERFWERDRIEAAWRRCNNTIPNGVVSVAYAAPSIG